VVYRASLFPVVYIAVGGRIGIMNIMLVSLSERRREISIHMVFGAN
jgi:ABC-type antimicrobial peptide transport system permease subunit